jgi:putative tricarboxylic transport membrane protein
MRKRVSVILVASLLAALLVAGCAANSQPVDSKAAPSYPTKPITVLNSSAAGSAADVMARQVAQVAEKTLGQPLVVNNVTGGNGGVMFASLLKENTDGYTIATLTASQIAALQSDLKKDFKFDDFEFIANVQTEPYAIVVGTDSPFKSIKDMMDYAAKNPMKLKVGGQGTGSAMHLLILELAAENNAKVTWVPLGGGSESVTSLLGKNVDVISTAPATVNQYVEAGKMRILAVSDAKRLEGYPDVPTLKELGYDDLVMTQYRGFVAKKGLDPDAKAKLVDAIKKATQDPAFKDYMAKNKMGDGYMGPEDFQNYAKKDFDNIGNLLAKFNTASK